MGTEPITVEVRLGKYDCVHLSESQACVHIEHPTLGEPLDLILVDDRAEEFRDCCWDEIVQRALDSWLAHTWMSRDRPRVLSFKELFESSSDVRVEFRRAWAADRMCQCQVELNRLQQEVARLRNLLAASDQMPKRIPAQNAA